MSKQITFNGFKGVNLDERLWPEGYASLAQGLDLLGLGDNPTKLAMPGVIQQSMSMSAMAENSSPSDITQLINDFDKYSSDGFVYGIDVSASGRIYRFDTSNNRWTWVSAIAVSGIGSNLKSYSGNLYYATNNYLGLYDGTAGYANFKQFSSANTLPRPMKVFGGNLFIGNGRYVDKYDGTTYYSQKLVLPSDFTVRSMEVYSDGLFISADNGQISRIFVWDGVSPTFLDQYSLPNEKFAPALVTGQGILWMIGTRGTLTNKITYLTPIYIFGATGPELLFNLPIFRDTTFSPNTGVATYQSGILVGSTVGSFSNPRTDMMGGAWLIGKDLNSGKYYATMAFPLGYQKTIGGIFSSGSTQFGTVQPALYIAFDDFSSGHAYKVSQASSPSISPNDISGATWVSLPIDAGSTNMKVWNGLRVMFDDLTAGQSIVISYYLDDSTSPITAKIFLAADDASTWSAFIPIRKKSRTITLRIQTSQEASTPAPAVHALTLFYSPTQA